MPLSVLMWAAARQSANAYRYFQREHDIEALLPAFARSLLSLRSR
jgi:hypothetical protein